jgi:transcription antitermination factor NusG
MQSEEPSRPAWYALRVKTRLAKTAATILTSKAYEVFLPLYREKHQWSDRTKECELPLFPGYLFCRFVASERLLPILVTPGVMSIVCAAKIPLSIPDREICAIEAVVHSGLNATPWPQLAAGTRVLVVRGPLAGVEGVTVNDGKACKLAVSISLLQRSVVVEINREWARPIVDEAVRRAPGQAFQVRHVMTA